MSTTITYTQADYNLITPEWLKANDGKVVWIRDDYLMCSGYVKETDPDMYTYLEHVYSVKQQAKKTGWTFDN